jgi:hypothetical protein
MSSCHLCHKGLGRSIVTVVVDDEQTFCFHSACFDTKARSPIKLSNLAIYGARRIVAVHRRAPPSCALCGKVVDEEDDEAEIVCSARGCDRTVVHRSCWTTSIEQGMRVLARQRTNSQSTDDLAKVLFSTKYDLARHIFRCACKNGHLKPMHSVPAAPPAATAPVRTRTKRTPPSSRQQPPDRQGRVQASQKQPSARERQNHGSSQTMVVDHRPTQTHHAEPIGTSPRSSAALPERKTYVAPPVPETAVVAPPLDTQGLPPKDLAGLPPISDCNVCPITRRVMARPVWCVDGHRYEEQALKWWIDLFGPVSPISTLPLRESFYYAAIPPSSPQKAKS